MTESDDFGEINKHLHHFANLCHCVISQTAELLTASGIKSPTGTSQEFRAR